MQLRADDSVSRRELSLDEVNRLYEAASKGGAHWRLLFATGIYTGLRLGDCCRLSWESVNLERNVIQVIPEKTKKHAHGKPVTIPIHPTLGALFSAEPEDGRKGYVNAAVADLYNNRNRELDEGIRRIFTAANVTMSVKMEGRSRKSVVASFHSFRHTFVSLSANAGVPLPVVQSIVGHCSTAMTRHYYHESEDALRQAVAAIPALGAGASFAAGAATAGAVARPAPEAAASAAPVVLARRESVPVRLRRLANLLSQGLISDAEHAAQRARILAEI